MFYCPNCNHKSEAAANFCPNCGNEMIEYISSPEPAPIQPVEAQPIYVQQVSQPVYPQQQYPQQPYQPQYPPQSSYQQPAYQQPAYQNYPYMQPKVEQPSSGKSIAGMILSIIGIALAAITFFSIVGSMGDFNGEDAFASGFFMMFLGFPVALIGFILSKGAVNNGDLSSKARVGKILGLIATILFPACLWLGFMALIIYE